MGRLNPEKLHVSFLDGTSPESFSLPRRYTLTHSDIIYTRLMRDEVLAELVKSGDGLELHVYCHISGGFVFGPARWRSDIFHSELPLALEAIRHGDRTLFEEDLHLDGFPVYVHFRSANPRFNSVEPWGIIGDYAQRARLTCLNPHGVKRT